jgi:hypothetical protein
MNPTVLKIECLACLVAAGLAQAAPERVPVTQDNSIILVEGEQHLNHGTQPNIRIKGNQHIVAMGIDPMPLRGKKVLGATLVCRQGDALIEGLTISTIQAPWEEATSNALTSGIEGAQGWAWLGAPFPAICGGNSGSLVCQSPSEVVDGWYHWKVAPDLVHAIATGLAHGLALHEWSADYSRNPTIHAREDKKNAPYLLVEFGEGDSEPSPPAELEISHTGARDGLRLSLTSPAEGFGYRVRINGADLPRWNIPFIHNGARQQIALRDIALAPGPVEVEVRTVDRLGRESPGVEARGMVPAPRKLPLPEMAKTKAGQRPPEGLAVRPPLDRVAATGEGIGGFDPDPALPNEVWNGASIGLSAARGEVVGFQLGIRGSGKQTIRCRLGNFRADIFRGVNVKDGGQYLPDPLLPVNGELNLQAGQETAVWVDLYIPFDAPPGIVAGAIELGDGRSIPIHLTIRSFALPRRASFLCEMNSYGFPDKVAEYYRLQQIAYDHRVHVNVLHYGQSTAQPGARKSNMDMLMANGHRMNEKAYNDIQPGAVTTFWDDFTTVFGPHLSGSYYAKGHRGVIPAPGFYLTFHESWPLNVREFWNGAMDAYQGFSKQTKYASTYEALVGDFVRLADAEGWHEAGFQIYLNNKPGKDDPSKNPWTLDEPSSYWDYRALNYYRDLTNRGHGNQPSIPLKFRIDISRPQFARNQLKGRHDLWVVSHHAFRDYRRMVTDRAERSGEEIWLYGSTSMPGHSARETQAWTLQAYRDGAAGVVPWQTVDKSGKALDIADQLGLFIFDHEAGDGDGAAIRHSVRLKAYRRAQQDIEYLELLRNRYRWTQAEMQQFMDHYLPLNGQVEKTSELDAGTTRYSHIDPSAFSSLREAAATLIEAKAAKL